MIAQMICNDCGVNTNRHNGGIAEYFMVAHVLWELYVPEHDGFLCIECLEARMGRELEPNDFHPCPVNMGIFGQSDRLLDRLGDTSWMFDQLTKRQQEIVMADGPTSGLSSSRV